MSWRFERAPDSGAPRARGSTGASVPTWIERGSERLTWRALLEGFACDSSFRRAFLYHLASRDMVGFCFETPCLRAAHLDRAFEFVLVDAPELDRPRPDPSPFEEHLRFGELAPEAAPSVVCFPNLGRDALLLVPTEKADSNAYGHLAAFVRSAPLAQQEELLIRVAEETQRRLSERPLWLNTAGHGVAWLHVRLDDFPKYVSYAPYRREA